MRKTLLKALMLTVPMFAFGQIFQENFDGTGPGIGAWTVIDNDGQTPAAAVAFITNGWNVIDKQGANGNFGGPAGDHAAMSTSWYDPAGTSDDWLISPAVTVSGTAPKLRWDAKAQDADYPDGYRLMLAPNGGNTIQDFTVELLNLAAEDAEWKSRFVDLAPYMGQSVRFAWVNNSTDKFMLLVDNVSVEDFVPPPAPDCPVLNLPANGATDVPWVDGVDFAWTAAATGGTATQYNFYLGTDPQSLTLLGSTPNLAVTVTGMQPSTTYYWSVTGANDGGESTGCTAGSFTTAASEFEPYCGPLSMSFSVEPITRVDFGGMNNVTDATVDGTPGHENFISMTANVVAGQSYDITLQGNTGGNFVNRFIVFIDWNQDATFDPTTETYPITQTIQNSTGTDAVQAVHTIAVPADALAGTTRMRVKKIYGTTNYANPCLGASFGQAEDYSVNTTVLAANDVSAKNAVRVYPNPVVDVMNIDSPVKVSAVAVYDATGKQVMSTSVNAAKSQVNLSRLAPGVYIVRTQSESGTQSFKVIKK